MVDEGFNPPEWMLGSQQEDNAENRGLFNAAKAGDLSAVRAALESGGSPNWFCQEAENMNAFLVACEQANVELMNVLLDAGAAVEAKALPMHNSAVHLAATASDAESAIRLLVQRGADVGAENSFGNTPLHEACVSGNIAAVNVLTELGGNLSARNHRGSHCLHFACYCKEFLPELVELVLAADCISINDADNEGMTPMHIAAERDSIPLARLLVQHGAALDLEDQHGHKPEFYAKKSADFTAFLESQDGKAGSGK